MKKVIVVYDDSMMPNAEIGTITGQKSYGDTIFKRVTLKNRMKEAVLSQKAVADFLVYKKESDQIAVFETLAKENSDAVVVHMYSNFAKGPAAEFDGLFTKASYINRDYVVMNDASPAMVLCADIASYKKAFEEIVLRRYNADVIEAAAFMDLSVRANFLTFITGGFDARFFNALEGDAYTVTKKSSKIEKIKSEYNFYYLLPEHMKMWFVQPYDYKEEKDYASYTMERFHMTDIAIRFVHGAVGAEELRDILDKLFYFAGHRAEKTVSLDEGSKVADELYVDKLLARMEDLKKLPEYAQFDGMIKMGSAYDSIDAITQKYLALYNKLCPMKKGVGYGGNKECKLAVGHGDMCFSNILYNKEASILKLIDPKGALSEDELYTDPYYDLAKLSHSICGCYDFFNSGLYQVSIDRDLKLCLTIDTEPDEYIAIFKEYLEKNGYDYKLVRLYEAGLFLSMLPYHMDQPGKVFGFLLNAVRILDEVE